VAEACDRRGFISQTAVAADFTGDDRIDVIASDITAGNEKLMLYVGPNWTPVVLGEGIRSIYAVAVDVNKDGRKDVIGARYHPGLIYWLEQPKMRFTIGGRTTQSTMQRMAGMTASTAYKLGMWIRMATSTWLAVADSRTVP
jgi:hypothetical protein